MKSLSIIAVLGLASLAPFLASAASDATCSESRPCKQGCCSKYGSCGFGPEFCSPKTCVSTCDAKSECGKYAPKGQEKCPLNVCCSRFGFCGPTESFCGKGCQNGCGEIKRPSCSGTSTRARYIGYFESWNYDRICDMLHPSKINTKPWTHLNYGFAQINQEDYTLTTMHSYDKEFYHLFTDLKKQKPSLKCFISIGGWDAGSKIFSDMAKSEGSRKAFIDSVIEFMEEYGFDGVDIDWEYPVADDRGGSKEDFKTYVQLLKELRAAAEDKYEITVALPASYWYLRGFDLKRMSKYVDWFNVMTYDIHGTWDGNNKWTQEVINPHTNLTEISLGLDLLWRNSVPPEKVSLGLAFYGRSFTLADPSCSTPGCPFKRFGDETSGGALPGLCTLNSGTLSDYEIDRVLKEKSPDVFYDQESGVNWITWDNDQWVSYDDGRTLKQKADFGNKLCLAGTFAWAIDLGGPGTLKNPNDLTADDTLRGADPQGGDGGSSEVYISPEIFKKKDPRIACVPPCTFIMPPISLASPSTITLPLYTTSLEVAWPTTQLVTLPGGSVLTSTGLARTIQTTTLTIPPITTSEISLWNWKVTDPDASSSRYTPISSILPPPFVITEKLPEGWVQGNPPKPTPGDGNPGVIISNGSDSKSGSDDHDISGHDRQSNPPEATGGTGHSAPESAAPDPTGAGRGINSLDGKKGNPNRGKNSQPATADTGRPTRGFDDSRHGRTTKGHENDHVITVVSGDSILNSHFPASTTNSPMTTRTITPPPFPYTTGTEEDNDDDDDDDNKIILPVVTFTKGPPDPLCTANCGKKCEGPFCDEPCEHNCGDGEDFFSENERTKPKNTQKCRGPDCKNGKCTGLLCINFGCIGLDCLDGMCWGPKCVITWCGGLKCIPKLDGCSGDGCKPSGCLGLHCNGRTGRCFGPKCIGFGCDGPDCDNGSCKGPRCWPLTCEGEGCQSGFCTGSKCETGKGGCDEARTARRCTELVSKIQTRSDKTEYFTTTNTRCHTVTACSVQPTTITTTTTMAKLPVYTGVGVTMTPPDTNEHYMALAQYLVYKIHSRDATRMFYIPEVATPTTTAKPKKSPPPAELKCFGSGSTSHRADMIRAIESFCNENKGRMIRKEDGKIIDYYGSRCFGPGACFVEVNISVELINDCDPFELDGGSPGDLCGHSFRQPVDECDTRGTSFKYGGVLTTDCARWIIDPGFNAPGGPKAKYPLLNGTGIANTTMTNHTASWAKFNSSSVYPAPTRPTRL
ncbi:bacteriodes thetaiotaomicron symbiotic chitinase [Blastomyces dermatitidis ER-3]|uniref:chitinase n=1 Tax=Ajellomyces dermatitidis (strain ER-3 / ATCC MYA-2586) TaxID=559297 RepID=A0ABP2EWQ6_AJEDR|nr:bacteriodes thetaiotaomicron symbiotic chitinase [Blastomyces dermatitidis ER-3]EEQ88507.2 bacteriodes thetaiotaomicron symbiotic chitinase [Blastomyces dermatitidis ER-3]